MRIHAAHGIAQHDDADADPTDLDRLTSVTIDALHPTQVVAIASPAVMQRTQYPHRQERDALLDCAWAARLAGGATTVLLADRPSETPLGQTVRMRVHIDPMDRLAGGSGPSLVPDVPRGPMEHQFHRFLDAMDDHETVACGDRRGSAIPMAVGLIITGLKPMVWHRTGYAWSPAWRTRYDGGLSLTAMTDDGMLAVRSGSSVMFISFAPWSPLIVLSLWLSAGALATAGGILILTKRNVMP
jgi:hypothetical protein